MLPMLHKRFVNHRAFAGACVALGMLATIGTTAGTATAAPPVTTPPQTTPITVRTLDATMQTPTIGVTRAGALPVGGFVAPLAAAAVGSDTTVVWLEPMPKDACTTTLSDAKVGVSWVNTSNKNSGDETFAACSGGKPTLSPPLTTGAGTLQFTVTVLGRGGNTFTLSPGTATITR